MRTMPAEVTPVNLVERTSATSRSPFRRCIDLGRFFLQCGGCIARKVVEKIQVALVVLNEDRTCCEVSLNISCGHPLGGVMKAFNQI